MALSFTGNTGGGGGLLPLSALKAIGIGPAFPFSLTGSGSIQTVATANGITKINESIHLILTTRPGERIMNPEFGSRIMDLVFEPNDAILQDLLYLYTAEALQRWERRISLEQVLFPTNEQDIANGIIREKIVYIIRQTNITGSYVFPFARYGATMSALVSGTPVAAPNLGSQNLASFGTLG
jgi:phage baseplate assembly protein W